ncbi:ABC transporter substrate-binding protein [Rhodococcus sp. NPDC058505]|uniref:ABC transporter substrate-binding protein n=1 Tax=unclassified Rhodococcus (in: high G+C Gram-positive bacteria) TaxID=192944 RepID=UPI003662BC74
MSRKMIVAVGLTAALLAGCAGTATDGASDSSSMATDPTATFRYATTYGTSSFDPHKTKVAQDNILLAQVYDRLVQRDPDANAIPGLATSWEFAPDGSTLTLHLREGVVFQDGTPFDAAAVKANLLRAKEPDSITTTMLAPVDRIDTPDPRTVVLGLNGPGAQLVLTLSDLPGMMVSPNAFGTPEKDAALVLDPVGAGRYTVARSTPGAEYEFASWDGYWDAESVGANRFQWTVMADPQTRLGAVASDQMDAAIATPLIIDPARSQGLDVEVQTSLNHYALNLNRTRSEFGTVEVRQAVTRAIDREVLAATALEGHGEAASQNFPSGYFAYNPDLADRFAYSEAEAKDLLARAGVPNGFTFTAGVMNLPENQLIAQIVQEQLEKVGIRMEIRTMTPQEMSPVFNRGELDAVLTTVVGRADPSLLLSTYYGATSPQNPSADALPGFQEALDAANRESDPVRRGELLATASAAAMDQAPMVPLAFSDIGGIVTDRVVGYQPYRAMDEWGGVGIAAAD